ncbi:MAG: right-handed parallel beta-helix repeat-containing protein [Candidatus Methanosuratincola sp.]|nr:right-handed parallel beta-helix repeat-containing protein [Candidatus Methanosuratincola sp.]
MSGVVGGGTLSLFQTAAVMERGVGQPQTPLQPWLPIEPAVELTVCPEGPPICQFQKIQDAIDAAPDTPPLLPFLETPFKIPLIHILPGIYVENLVILKSVWLQGVGQELVTLRSIAVNTGIQTGELSTEEVLRPTVFIASSNYLVVGLEGLAIEGGLQIVGLVRGFIRNNSFKIGGILLTGTLADLLIADNSITTTFVGIRLLKVGRIPGVGEAMSVAIVNNSLYNNQPPLGRGNAIEVWESEDVFIGLNQIFRNNRGVYILNTENITIQGNVFKHNNTGIHAYFSRRVSIPDNLLE